MKGEKTLEKKHSNLLYLFTLHCSPMLPCPWYSSPPPFSCGWREKRNLPRNRRYPAWCHPMTTRDPKRNKKNIPHLTSLSLPFLAPMSCRTWIEKSFPSPPRNSSPLPKYTYIFILQEHGRQTRAFSTKGQDV